MATSSWPVIKQLRALFSRKSSNKTQRYVLNIDLAAEGTLERVRQCKRIRDFWQRMRDDSWEAFQEQR